MNRGGINHRQIKMVNLTYHWHMYVIISLWNIIELCRTFRRDITAKKQQLVTLKVKNLWNNRKKSIISNFDDNDGRVVAGIYPYSYLAYIHVARSPVLPLTSEQFPISSAQKCSGFATTKLQVRNERKCHVTGSCWFLQNLDIAYSFIKRHTYANLVANILQ